MVRLGDEDGNGAFTDIDDDAVPGCMVGVIDIILTSDCEFDGDNGGALEDTVEAGFICNEDD